VYKLEILQTTESTATAMRGKKGYEISQSYI
jgi:hypothetical protein